MEPELEDQQKLLLWLLAVQPDGGAFLKAVPISLSRAKRTTMVSAGFTDENQRKNPVSGRNATFLELTDKGWEWCQDHLTEAITSRSPRVKDVLSGLLQILNRYFKSQDECPSLSDLIAQAQPLPAAESNAEVLQPADSVAIQAAIQEACRVITGGRNDVRVRLADLRPHLNDFPREEVDAELLAMESAGMLRTWQLDNSSEITAADREAVLISTAGSRKHILYYGNTQS